MPCCDEASHKVSVRWSAQSPASMKKYRWNERNASITLSSSLNSLHEMKGVAFATWATSHVHKEGKGLWTGAHATLLYWPAAGLCEVPLPAPARQQAQQWGQSHQLWLTPHELVQAAPLQLQSQQIQMQYYYKAHAITPQGLAWRPWLRQLQQQVRPCAPAELQLLEPPALPYSHHFKEQRNECVNE
ncbi:MAG: hypothetical protein FRX49_08148 [Trebouxia sp. A1-2]|nr:MAG: hypothetical protein FRX49_08148 [Trebouxia sp. A1-2]